MRYLITLAIFLPSISALGQSQNGISIARIGKDKIAIYNPNHHAVALEIGEEKSIILPSHQGKATTFLLNNYNVENTQFRVFYNDDCARVDSLQCELQADKDLADAQRRAWRAGLVTSLLQGTNAGILLDVLNSLFGNNKELTSEILAAYRSNDVYEQKWLRINKILENYFVKQIDISVGKEVCLQRVRHQLGNNTVIQKYYPSQFIKKQENFRFEIAPYYVFGFNAMQYKGVVSKRPSFGETGAGEQRPLGVRANFNFNAYTKFKQRKVDKKFYLCVDYSQSPAIYKKTPYGPFKKDTAYAWNFYSIGVGWETLYKNVKGNYNSSFSFDLGVVTSSNLTYSTDSLKSIKTKVNGEAFKEFNVYACLTLKQKIFSWVDLFGSYKIAGSLFTRQDDNGNREIPSFRQFQLGMNFIIARKINYQY